MKGVLRILVLVLRDQRAALLRGAALTVAVLAMGVALLGLSGWFITAAAMAGLAGTGAVFDVFRPSAMVRLLALGRAGARYGERLLTHDATLRALQTLRLRLLAAQLAAPHDRMIRLRGAQALNRLTADVDALDGVPLRLVLPLFGGIVTFALAFGALWLLVGPGVAAWVVGGWLVGVALILARSLGPALPQARRAEQAAQAFRARLVDLIRARRDLAVHGALAGQAASVMAADRRRILNRRHLDRIERQSGAALGILLTCVVAGALGLGLSGVAAGTITPPFAALGVFVALALAEAVQPLRRAIADLGRMADAARRVGQGLETPGAKSVPGPADLPQPETGLVVAGLSLHRPQAGGIVVQGFDLQVAPGECLALTGPSGAGKSTLLLAIAGLHPRAEGEIRILGTDLAALPEDALRSRVALLPQRHGLMAGTVADALRIADPAATEAAMIAALTAVQLWHVLAPRGGLDLMIGPRGEGLSGGEGRRLALARVALRHPAVLLLDEPTEGLDDATAAAVLAGLRQMLPAAAIVMASHRAVELAMADRVMALPGRPCAGSFGLEPGDQAAQAEPGTDDDGSQGHRT